MEYLTDQQVFDGWRAAEDLLDKNKTDALVDLVSEFYWEIQLINALAFNFRTRNGIR